MSILRDLFLPLYLDQKILKTVPELTKISLTGFQMRIFKQKKQDLKLIFLFVNEDKDSCYLREIQVIDILPEEHKKIKRYKVPKTISQILYNTEFVPYFESILNKMWRDPACRISHKMRSENIDMMNEYSKLLQKVKKKYGDKINYVICGAE